MEELTIKIEIRKDKLVEVLAEGFSGDFIEIVVGKAFDPCIIEDEYLVVTQTDEDISSKLKISIQELGLETIYALVYELMKIMREQDKMVDMYNFLLSMLDSFDSIPIEQANDYILKILEKVG